MEQQLARLALDVEESESADLVVGSRHLSVAVVEAGETEQRTLTQNRATPLHQQQQQKRAVHHRDNLVSTNHPSVAALLAALLSLESLVRSEAATASVKVASDEEDSEAETERAALAAGIAKAASHLVVRLSLESLVRSVAVTGRERAASAARVSAEVTARVAKAALAVGSGKAGIVALDLEAVIVRAGKVDLAANVRVVTAGVDLAVAVDIARVSTNHQQQQPLLQRKPNNPRHLQRKSHQQQLNPDQRLNPKRLSSQHQQLSRSRHLHQQQQHQ